MITKKAKDQMRFNIRQFLYCSTIRAIKTGLQVFVAMAGTNTFITEVSWINALSAVVMSMILSYCTSAITGLPEV